MAKYQEIDLQFYKSLDKMVGQIMKQADENTVVVLVSDQGCVESGEEYEKVRDEIINVLYDYTDEETGVKPIKVALKREDARILGLYGDMIGDVVFAISPKFGEQHGPHLPTAEVW